MTAHREDKGHILNLVGAAVDLFLVLSICRQCYGCAVRGLLASFFPFEVLFVG